MSDDQFGKLLLAAPGLFALVSLLKVSWSGSPVPALVLVVIAAICGLLFVNSTIGGKRVSVKTGPGHGTWTAARHEAGHYLVAQRLGARVTGAEIFPDGSGVTHLRMPRNATVEEHVAVDVAGHVGAGTTAGCDSDFSYMRQELKGVPYSQRAAKKRAGYALARKNIHGHISLAKKIYRNGQVK
jgi:hypothetical protein